MATVDGLRGIIATGETIEACRVDLIEVIEEWITIRLQRGLDIPAMDGHGISVSREPMAIVRIIPVPYRVLLKKLRGPRSWWTGPGTQASFMIKEIS